MDANIKEMIQLLVGSGGFIAILIVMLKIGRIVEKVDNLATKVDNLAAKMDKELCQIHEEQKCTNKILNDLAVRMGCLETRVEERTLRVIHVEKNVEARVN